MREHAAHDAPGGERVVTERAPGVRSVALGFWIGAGSRDEPAARAGVSHFIEHLLFKGSSRYCAQEIAEIFDAMGGELNAATSRETTVVYTRVPDDRLERALDVMADMVFAPAFDDVDCEREVVLEEIAMVDDNPQDLVHDLAAEAVFGRHPLGRPVIGTRRRDLDGLAARARAPTTGGAYVGSNVVLAAAGQRRARRACVELLRRAPRRAANGASRARRPLLRPAAEPGLRFQRKDTEQYHVVPRAGPGSRRDDERRYAASLLDAILGGSASSRLFQEIREKRGMAYSVYTYGSQYAETGQVGVYVGTREDNLAECLEITADGARRRRRRQPAAGRARAGEGEPQGPPAALARVHLDPHDAARQGADHRHGARLRRGDDRGASTAVTEAEVAALAARALRAGAALGRRHRPAARVASGPRSRASTRRSPEPSVKVCALRRGRQGRAASRRPPSSAPGTRSSTARSAGPDGCDAAVDFTRPDAVLGNVERCLARRAFPS